jgi:hypothetical protein
MTVLTTATASAGKVTPMRRLRRAAYDQRIATECRPEDAQVGVHKKLLLIGDSIRAQAASIRAVIDRHRRLDADMPLAHW